MKSSGRKGSGAGNKDTGAHRAAAGAPEIRAEKVAKIQSSIDSGTYRVEGRKVANKMVADAVQEIRNRSR